MSEIDWKSKYESERRQAWFYRLATVVFMVGMFAALWSWNSTLDRYVKCVHDLTWGTSTN